MNELEKIQGISTPQQPTTSSKSSSDGVSFGDTLQGFLTDVNHMQNTADESIQKMVAGEVKDVHQVMLAVEEAKVAFNMMLEIRNKTLEAYNEVLRMRG